MHMDKDSLHEQNIHLPSECHLPEAKSQFSSSSVLSQMITTLLYQVKKTDHSDCYAFYFFPEKLVSFVFLPTWELLMPLFNDMLQRQIRQSRRNRKSMGLQKQSGKGGGGSFSSKRSDSLLLLLPNHRQSGLDSNY